MKSKSFLYLPMWQLFYCIFPDFFSNTLAKFLDIYFCDGRPEFIFLRENFFMFNIYYEVFSNIEYLQISLLILVAKDRGLKLCKDERIEKFNQFNCISQSLIITQFTSKLLSSANLNDNLITAFGDFITDYNMHDWKCIQVFYINYNQYYDVLECKVVCFFVLNE